MSHKQIQDSNSHRMEKILAYVLNDIFFFTFLQKSQFESLLRKKSIELNLKILKFSTKKIQTFFRVSWTVREIQRLESRGVKKS